jgi:hypothetical protein
MPSDKARQVNLAGQSGELLIVNERGGVLLGQYVDQVWAVERGVEQKRVSVQFPERKQGIDEATMVAAMIATRGPAPMSCAANPAASALECSSDSTKDSVPRSSTNAARSPCWTAAATTSVAGLIPHRRE